MKSLALSGVTPGITSGVTPGVTHGVTDVTPMMKSLAVESLMDAAAVGAAAAAAASTRVWGEYELAVARSQDWDADDMPREGE